MQLWIFHIFREENQAADFMASTDRKDGFLVNVVKFLRVCYFRFTVFHKEFLIMSVLELSSHDFCEFKVSCTLFFFFSFYIYQHIYRG